MTAGSETLDEGKREGGHCRVVRMGGANGCCYAWTRTYKDCSKRRRISPHSERGGGRCRGAVRDDRKIERLTLCTLIAYPRVVVELLEPSLLDPVPAPVGLVLLLPREVDGPFVVAKRDPSPAFAPEEDEEDEEEDEEEEEGGEEYEEGQE